MKLRTLPLILLAAIPAYAGNAPKLEGSRGETVPPEKQVMIFVDARAELATPGERRRFNAIVSRMMEKYPERRSVVIRSCAYREAHNQLAKALAPEEYVTDLVLLDRGSASLDLAPGDNLGRLNLLGMNFIHPQHALIMADNRHYPLGASEPWRYELFEPIRGRLVKGAHVLVESHSRALDENGALPMLWGSLLRASLEIEDGTIMLSEPWSPSYANWKLLEYVRDRGHVFIYRNGKPRQAFETGEPRLREIMAGDSCEGQLQ